MGLLEIIILVLIIMWLVGALAGYGLFHLLLIVIVILILFRFFGPPARRSL